MLCGQLRHGSRGPLPDRHHKLVVHVGSGLDTLPHAAVLCKWLWRMSAEWGCCAAVIGVCTQLLQDQGLWRSCPALLILLPALLEISVEYPVESDLWVLAVANCSCLMLGWC